MNAQRQEVVPANPSFTSAPSGLLQCKCACGNHTHAGGECEECKKNRLGLHRRMADRSEVSEVPPIVHSVLRSPGQPLDPATRAFMESRFGHDFSGVRVHTDTKAVESARVVNANAYTVGRHVAFGARQYAPETFEGQRLIAHELTHVLQQSSNRNNLETVNSVVDPLDEIEMEADNVALEVINTYSSPSMIGFGSEASKIQKANFDLSVSPLTIQRDKRPWPVNGYVINNSDEPVTVWSDNKGQYKIPANSTSGRFSEDVDHIKDKNGNWYKIGPNTVTVDKNGNISGYKCNVANYGEDCSKK